MDEETMKYYHYNLYMQPEGINYAVNYLRSVLHIFQRYNGEDVKDLMRQLKSMKLVRKDQLEDKEPERIVHSFEQGALEATYNTNWQTKIARYLAYILDGGILCSQFTLRTYNKFLANVSDSKDMEILKNEFCYLLHIRKHGQPYERGETLSKKIKTLMNTPKEFTYNSKVLIVLIECGYIQQELSYMNYQEYPKFLISMLGVAKDNKVKESCCRMIINFFGEKKKKDAPIGDAGDGKGAGDES